MPNLASVVTSVTIVETTDEEARQRYELPFSFPCDFHPCDTLFYRYEAEYMKNRKKSPPEDKTPKFEFYLYNDAGRIIKQYLSIHEIQQILLQQSQNLGENYFLAIQKNNLNFSGLQQLAWLIGRNETNWRPTEQPRRTLPTTTTTPKTPLTMATNSIGNNSQVENDILEVFKSSFCRFSEFLVKFKALLHQPKRRMKLN